MLFDSTLRKELSRSFGGTLVVILTIVLTMMLIRVLGMAAGGEVSPQDVVLLLGYTALGHLPTMLSLSLFIAVVSTLTRLYRDSEMAVWFSSGLSLGRFVQPVLRFAAPGLVAICAPATSNAPTCLGWHQDSSSPRVTASGCSSLTSRPVTAPPATTSSSSTSARAASR
jgi:lipopolysaccharide export LptBFGC system permease protein LptF